LAVLVAACGGERDASDSEGGVEDMPMGAMEMPSMNMMPAVRAYLDSVARAEPDELVEMAGGHAARMEELLAAMDQDMQAMNMTADAAWQALADSARADLAATTGLGGEQLMLRMRAHAGRMRRLLDMHERMMGHMQM
jgi:hypothetical protein